jgi:hypothetical protein
MKLTLTLITLLLFSFCCPSHSFASDLYFSDDFTILDYNTWETFGPSQGIIIANDKLYLSPLNGRFANYIRAKRNLFPSEGDFKFEIKFKYDNPTFWGTGIVATTLSPDYPQPLSQLDPNKIFTIWQDKTFKLNGLYKENFINFGYGQTNTEEHVSETIYRNGHYYFYIDDALVYESENGKRPTSLWFGNPGDPQGPLEWTSFNIDYIRVRKLDLGYIINTESSWDNDGRQLPIDRVADITVKVTDTDGNNVHNATVSASTSVNTSGQFESITQMTNSQGEAFFRFTPGQEGIATLSFAAKGVTSSLEFNVYRPPVVIVPGMLASFNAMKFFIDDFDQENWRWSSTAEQGWDETITMLRNNNYVEDEDYSVAFYDWRKTLDSSFYIRRQIEPVYKNLYPAIDVLLQNRPGGQKVNILAHSFGGLLTRSMIQNNLDRDRVNQFITFATPHQGASAAYYPWEGGVTASNGDPISGAFLNLIMKVYTNHSGESGMAFFRSKFPSIKNLLPTYDYIRHGSTPIFSNDLIHKNDVLLNTMNTNNLKTALDSRNIRFTSFYSTDHETLDSITTFTPTPNSDIWPDGQPLSLQDTVNGDNAVLPKSAVIPQLASQKVAGVHGDVPDNSREYVANLLKINSQPIAGKKSPLSFLWVMVLSPAYAEILNSDGEVISIKDNWTEVDVKNSYATDLTPGIYSIKVTGTDQGSYTAYVPYFSLGSKYEKEYHNVTYPGKVDWIDMFIGDDNQTSTSQLVRAKMLLLPDLASLIKRQLLINSVFDLPKDYDTSQLKLETVWLNGKILPVRSSNVDKKNRKLTLQISAKDFAKAVDWKESELNIRMVISGKETSLFGEKSFKFRWSDYKNKL